MKRALSDFDTAACEVVQKRRRHSLSATHIAPTSQWANVMGWLRAVPSGASPEKPRITPRKCLGTKIHPHTYSIPAMDSRGLDTRRGRKLQTRKRSVSPTKKPTEYRSILLSEAGIFIDCNFEAPDSAPNLEELAVPSELRLLVDRIAKEYCEECRDSAMKGQGEGDWRANASVTVMNKLRRYESFAKILNVNGSDKPWRAELKPERATTVIQRMVMPPSITISPMVVEPKDSTAAAPDQPDSFSSSAGVIFKPPFDNRPAHFETLDNDTLSYTSRYTSTSNSDPESLSTPKPDICVGLEHRSFQPSQQQTLNYLKTDPHAQAIGLHFPFLIFEAKGNAGLFGAQNQAAVGAACMLRILDLVSCGDMVAWSVATEGPIHELWVHHRDVEKKYQSVNKGVWRVTNEDAANAFVGAMAKILLWGSTVYKQRILQALDGMPSFRG
ncbi:hypothetical protein PMIN02_012703 [Paraphaeosphaeria minitans]